MNPRAFFEGSDRLFMRGAADRDRIAAFVRETYPDEAARLVAAADMVVAQRFVFEERWDMERTHVPEVFPGAIDWLHQPGDDPEWIFAFNRMRFWITLGRAYALTGDERYANAFAGQLVHWVRTVRRDDPANAKAWRTIEAGIRMEYWVKAMACFEGSPAITPEVMDAFVASMTEHAEFLMGVWNSYNLMSNWGVLANHGLFIVGAAVPAPRAGDYRREAARRLAEEARIQIDDDGFQWEQSPMYHNEVTSCYLDVVTLADRGGHELPEPIRRKTRDLCRVTALSGKPDGHELSMGDSDDIDQRDLVVRGAVIFSDPLLRAFGGPVMDVDAVWDLGADAIAAYAALPAEPPRSVDTALHHSGNFYLRDRWGEDGTFVHFHCGTLGAGHGHSDKLHVDLFARGEDILVDAGRYTYVDKPERFEFKNATAHNTVTVDDEEVYTPVDSWGCSRLSRAVNRRFVAGDRYAYAEGGHLGYQELASGGVFVNRRLLFLKPDILVITDEFHTGAAHAYQRYFHFDSRGKVTGDGRRFGYDSARNAVDLLLVGGEPRARLVESRLSRRYNEVEANLTLRVDDRGDGPLRLFTVIGLNPAGRREALSAAAVPVTSNFKGVRFDDATIHALDITKGERAFTVVIAHREYASPTDTFNADGCTGFGEVSVFDRSAGETSVGTILVR